MPSTLRRIGSRQTSCRLRNCPPPQWYEAPWAKPTLSDFCSKIADSSGNFDMLHSRKVLVFVLFYRCLADRMRCGCATVAA